MKILLRTGLAIYRHEQAAFQGLSNRLQLFKIVVLPYKRVLFSTKF